MKAETYIAEYEKMTGEKVSQTVKENHLTEMDSRVTEETLIKTLTKTLIKISAEKTKTATAVTTDRVRDVTLADAAAWIFQHRKNH